MADEKKQETQSTPEPAAPIKLIDLGESVIELENIACVDKVYKKGGGYFWWQKSRMLHGIEVYYTLNSGARFYDTSIFFDSEIERDRQYDRLVKGLAEIRSIATEVQS